MFDRRSMLAELGVAGAMLAAPAISAASKAGAPFTPIRPPRLREGDTLGLVAPAGFVADRFGLMEIEDAVRAMGLVPKAASHMLDRDGYLAGSDRDRAADLNAMFADRDVRAIMAVRGGWGCARILPHLDFTTIRANPKLLVGSSDITALHLALAAHTGIASIHGPNAAASWPTNAWQSFRSIAFDGATPTYTVPRDLMGGSLGRTAGRVRTFAGGKARGRLLGGNLSVFSALVGTAYMPDLTGAILFLEDTNEAEYRIDRMLTQLALAGILGKVAGVVFGQCTNCENPGSSFGNFTIYEVLDRQFSGLGVPAFQGALIGHIANQHSIPVGVMAEIDADAGTIRLLETAVT